MCVCVSTCEYIHQSKWYTNVQVCPLVHNIQTPVICMHLRTCLEHYGNRTSPACPPLCLCTNSLSLSLFCSPPLSLASSLSPSLSFSYPLTYTTCYLIHTFQLWLPHASCCSMTVYTYTHTRIRRVQHAVN